MKWLLLIYLFARSSEVPDLNLSTQIEIESEELCIAAKEKILAENESFIIDLSKVSTSRSRLEAALGVEQSSNINKFLIRNILNMPIAFVPMCIQVSN